jgi:hypothetical protein
LNHGRPLCGQTWPGGQARAGTGKLEENVEIETAPKLGAESGEIEI